MAVDSQDTQIIRADGQPIDPITPHTGEALLSLEPTSPNPEDSPENNSSSASSASSSDSYLDHCVCSLSQVSGLSQITLATRRALLSVLLLLKVHPCPA